VSAAINGSGAPDPGACAAAAPMIATQATASAVIIRTYMNASADCAPELSTPAAVRKCLGLAREQHRCGSIRHISRQIPLRINARAKINPTG
jgi:hypothetical protein